MKNTHRQVWPRIAVAFAATCGIGLPVPPCFAGPVFVEISGTPPDGFIVCPLDVTPVADGLAISRLDGAEFLYGDRKVDAVFVPGDSPTRGTFVAVLPGDIPRGTPCQLRFENKDGSKPNAPEPPIAAGAVVFDAAKQGGLPSGMTFPDGKTLQAIKWFDRLHDPATGSWDIRNDKDAAISLVADKPFLKVIRITAAFKQGNASPPSQPKAVYDWFVFPQRALVYATVFAQQETSAKWKEKHVFELHIPDGSFTNWFGDDRSGTFTGSKQSQTFNRYAGFLDDSNNIVATIAPGTILYDGLKSFGPYLMPRGNDAWQAWADTKHRASAWYWIGNSPEPGKALQSAYETVRSMPQARIVIPELEQAAKDWKAAALNDLFLSGKIASKKELQRLRDSGVLPENWFGIEQDALGMILEKTDHQEKGQGLRLLSLVDKLTKTILSAKDAIPLFTAELLDRTTGNTVSITSDDGWESVDADGRKGMFEFAGSHLPEGTALRIVLRAEGHPGVTWHWHVLQGAERYEFRKLNCPQIALRNLGPAMNVVYPHASGVVTKNPVGEELRWKGTYPSGWCSMQWTAAYDETKKTGLYIAMHDSGGAVKNIRIDGDFFADSLTVRFEHPLSLGEKAASIGHGGGVWQTFHGDWFDAALIYRQWMRNHAEWYPKHKLGPDGRTDVPRWIKELSVWALCSDPPQKMPETMRAFTDAFGIPTAVHWYNWHHIPFDNDYPHYFPAKDGFKEAVADIQKNGDCYVMPYINGRLWDTRDKGTEDFQFTSVALPGTAKKETGKPYIETYNSKESDGSKVELAVMCPAADVWKNKVAENIFRLMNDCGVHGVYVDQVAAAKPELCFDPSHGHPLAGGDWWNREHWKLYEKIRGELPKGKMLTTECNSEPFINIFDGYLTWHFQYQGQIPAFAAVYGGVVQMFGRAYRGGPSQVLADRMKAAEQLVYGEQIGWIGPHIVNDPKRFPFFKEIVLTRHKYRDYFYKGEMSRPPKILDGMPTVTADWQWSGETIITTDAVLTGAWRKTDGNGKTISAVFFFVNVSEEPIASRVALRLDEIGLASKAFDNPLTFAPGVPLVFELFPE